MGIRSNRILTTRQHTCRIRRYRVCPVGTLSVVILLLLAGVLPANAASEETTYQCTPSGFTLGISPIKGPPAVETEREDQTWPVPYGRMQEVLAKYLYKSTLFSDVVTFTDRPQPDSTDLSLLVSIPAIREISGGIYPVFELMVQTMLVENMGGAAIFSKTYNTSFESTHSSGLPIRERVNAETLIGFSELIPKMVEDLDRELRLTTSPEYAELKRTKTVVHNSLEPLWMLPPIVTEETPGMENYSRFVSQKLRERLERKDCFTFMTPPEDALPCLTEHGALEPERLVSALRDCPVVASMDGMLLITQLSGDNGRLQIRSLLVYVPDLSILYDRVFEASSGWRMGNAIEAHSAGIAQASHSIAH